MRIPIRLPTHLKSTVRTLLRRPDQMGSQWYRRVSSCEAAKLRLFMVDGSTGTYPAYALLRDWAHDATYTYYSPTSSLAWDAAGTLTAGVDHDATAVANVGSSTTGQYVEFSLNATGIQAIQDWIDGTRENYGFAICGKGGATDGIQFTSFDGANKPELVLTLSGIPSSSSSSSMSSAQGLGELQYTFVAASDIHEGPQYFGDFLSYVTGTLGETVAFCCIAGDSARNGTNYLQSIYNEAQAVIGDAPLFIAPATTMPVMLRQLRPLLGSITITTALDGHESAL